MSDHPCLEPVAVPAPPTPLRHPGPRQACRRRTVPTTVATTYTALRPGARLTDALAEVVDDAGVPSAQFELRGGTLDRISYCIPDLCRDGSAAMAFSPTREARTPAQLLSASVTVGHQDGQRFVHCHAAWLDADGELHAGHLWPETTTETVPICATVHLLHDVEMISTVDPETRMPAFTPRRATAGRPAGGPTVAPVRGVIGRLLPGQDLTAAVATVCADNGLRHAWISGSLGSLVGAGLRHRDGPREIDGPGTEVVSLTGTAAVGIDEQVDIGLHALLVDRHGAVHVGALLPDRNLIAVTFELLLIEEST